MTCRQTCRAPSWATLDSESIVADGTFIELESVVDDADVTVALRVVHAVLGELGIDASDFTDETYTAAVLAARASAPR